jgi:hypothetical protein
VEGCTGKACCPKRVRLAGSFARPDVEFASQSLATFLISSRRRRKYGVSVVPSVGLRALPKSNRRRLPGTALAVDSRPGPRLPIPPWPAVHGVSRSTSLPTSSPPVGQRLRPFRSRCPLLHENRNLR